MASCQELARTLARLIRWALEDVRRTLVAAVLCTANLFSACILGHRVLRDEVHDGEWHVDNLGVALPKHSIFVVPGSALEEETFEVAALLWWLAMRHLVIGMLQNLVFKVDLVDWMVVFAGKILLDAGQERLREEEARDPEAVGLARLYPSLKRCQALLEVLDVAKERFATRIRKL